jgi:hypothetical protein
MSALVVFISENKKVSVIDSAYEDDVELCDRRYDIDLAIKVTLEKAKCDDTKSSAA